MKKILYITLALVVLNSCNKFLNQPPRDVFPNSQELWNEPTAVSATAMNYYTTLFPGYSSFWSRSNWFTGTYISDCCDDIAQGNGDVTLFQKNIPTSSSKTSWNFTDVTSINKALSFLEKSTMEKTDKEHWIGIYRFFRALTYANLVSLYGNVPYYDKVLTANDDKELYKPFNPRTQVMDSVLADLNYACEHVKAVSASPKSLVDKYVVYAYKSRIMLFEGTWEKYREHNEDYAKKYLKECMDASEFIMKSGNYHLCDNYKDLTTSTDLSNNPEVLMFRNYQLGLVTNCQMSYQCVESQKSSPSKDLIDSYLSKNGLPIHQKENYEFVSDTMGMRIEFKDRDPRLYANVDSTGYKINGRDALYAVSAYLGNRFVNPKLIGLPEGSSNTNTINAPIMKYNEVLMNYIEAAAELQTLSAYNLTQADFDKTINVIRDRPSTHMPHVQLVNNKLAVNSIIIDDPDRDPTVPQLIWEIRRERRIELVFEGKRFNDLRRWSKLDYADMTTHPKINMGAWINKNEIVEEYNKHLGANDKPIKLSDLSQVLQGGKTDNSGYIITVTKDKLKRVFNEKNYLYPIPLDQISLYKEHGYTITNNPGW